MISRDHRLGEVCSNDDLWRSSFGRSLLKWWSLEIIVGIAPPTQWWSPEITFGDPLLSLEDVPFRVGSENWKSETTISENHCPRILPYMNNDLGRSLLTSIQQFPLTLNFNDLWRSWLIIFLDPKFQCSLEITIRNAQLSSAQFSSDYSEWAEMGAVRYNTWMGIQISPGMGPPIPDP